MLSSLRDEKILYGFFIIHLEQLIKFLVYIKY